MKSCMNNDFAIDKVKSIKITFIEEDKKTELFWHKVVPNTTSMYIEKCGGIISDWNNSHIITNMNDGVVNIKFYASPEMINGENVLFTYTQTDIESADTLYEEDFSGIESFLSGFKVKDGE